MDTPFAERHFEVDADFVCAVFQMMAAYEDLRARTGLSGLPSLRGIRVVNQFIVDNAMIKDESRATVTDGNRRVPVTMDPGFAAHLSEWSRRAAEDTGRELAGRVVEVPTPRAGGDFEPKH